MSLIETNRKGLPQARRRTHTTASETRMTKRKEQNKMKLLYNIYKITIISIILWFVLSIMDIVADNNLPNAVHSQYNMFILYINMLG